MKIEPSAGERRPAAPDDGDPTTTSGRKPLSPAAERALTEAAQRRKARADGAPKEVDGRGGLEPVRYGDWEIKGLASDF